MRLSTKSRYAITAMLDLTLNGTKGPVTLADISENQNISLSYLEQLFAGLRAKGLVRGVRGPGGGYYLGREAEEITIADVICAVDDWVEYSRKHAPQSSSDIQHGGTRGLWEDLSNQIFEFVDQITLHDVVQRGDLIATRQSAPAKSAEVGRLRGRAA